MGNLTHMVYLRFVVDWHNLELYHRYIRAWRDTYCLLTPDERKELDNKYRKLRNL